MLPSIKTVERAFPGAGREISRILGYDRDRLEYEYPAVAEYARSCYRRPALHELQLIACNAAAGTHGVEYVPRGRNQNSPGFEYLNTGDSYLATLVRFDDGRYRIASLGDLVERGSYD